jgi:hypothetical protein
MYIGTEFKCYDDDKFTAAYDPSRGTGSGLPLGLDENNLKSAKCTVEIQDALAAWRLIISGLDEKNYQLYKQGQYFCRQYRLFDQRLRSRSR